ncbi:MAG: A/G-specific adenine glycosylase [Acidobacteria bacterium]|nr:A/G-specific adenine glycosylase [Acidobacteriota bacterium]MCI0717613.1 A/G-specific adenine glycosylase [Acidobacteriota bacterium]
MLYLARMQPHGARQSIILQLRLLKWYEEHQRNLPWRHTTDPYSVWISEVMLQQTQVQTVIPYYLRFLEHFPTIAVLARAETDQLLRVWAGLGYYSRARNLHKAARVIVERFGGKFPENYADVLALPGVGRYTAAAIVSIAFGQPYAVLDGNVSRVLARLLRISGDPKSSAVQSRLWTAAQQLLPAARPGDFNQALMELGATVCSPRQPQCSLCPWKQKCLARKDGLQESLPEKARRGPVRRSLQAAAVIRHQGRFLIVQRSGQRLLKGFWEFPSAELRQKGSVSARLARFAAETYGLAVAALEPLMTIRHAITTRRIELQVFQAKLAGGAGAKMNGKDCRWVRLKEMDYYPFASASRKIVEKLKGIADGGRQVPLNKGGKGRRPWGLF